MATPPVGCHGSFLLLKNGKSNFIYPVLYNDMYILTGRPVGRHRRAGPQQ
jgi:hypothetical protein